MATVFAIGHARDLAAKAREAKREEGRQRRRAREYREELRRWCAAHNIALEEYGTEGIAHGPGQGTGN